jgi:hypothetical protein
MISALPLKADMEVDFANVGLGPKGYMATTRGEGPQLRSSGLECFAKPCDHRQRTAVPWCR